jgi:hypothetical protein
MYALKIDDWLSQLQSQHPVTVVRHEDTIHILTDDNRAATVAWESKPTHADVQVTLRLKRSDGSIIPFSSHRDSALSNWYGMG